MQVAMKGREYLPTSYWSGRVQRYTKHHRILGSGILNWPIGKSLGHSLNDYVGRISPLWVMPTLGRWSWKKKTG